MALAVSCGYPEGYFDNLKEDNDEELEIERNDVRDVARSVSSLDSGNFGDNEHKSPSLLILERIVSACNNSILQSVSHCPLPPETAVHTLSALAKPLNKLGRHYKEHPNANECSIIMLSLLALGNVCERLNLAFDSLSISQLLPVSRLALMGMASLSPLFSFLADISTRQHAMNDVEKQLIQTFEHTMKSCVHQAIISSAKIPELVAESTLQTSRYDIIGAMRGPGGEDHGTSICDTRVLQRYYLLTMFQSCTVGCIALMRFAFESDILACAVLKIYGPSVLHDLSGLYHELKSAEQDRQSGCDYGIGVSPMSRRLVLKTLSRLSMLQMNNSLDQQSEGRAILHQLLNSPLSEIRSQKNVPTSFDTLFRICEASYDLASFSPELVVDLFSNSTEDIGYIFECVVSGYSGLSFASDTDAMCEQWGRLRGGALCLLRNCFKRCIPEYCVGVISAIIKAECDSATTQCNQGPPSGSNFFNDVIIGEDKLHAGAFITAVGECLSIISSRSNERSVEDCRRCVRILQSSAPVVIPLILHPSPEASGHVDPRPTIAEAWFRAMTSLVEICRNNEQIASHLIADNVQDLIGSTLYATIALTFGKDLGSKKAPPSTIQNGMSLDGPQTLAMMEFATESILLGPSILSAAGESFTNQVQLQPIQESPSAEALGAAIVATGLLRAASGALPPWAVELTPTLLRSVNTALGSDTDIFIAVLMIATKLQTARGDLLAGRYFENVSSIHIDSFLSKTKEICIKGMLLLCSVVILWPWCLTVFFILLQVSGIS